MIRFRVSSNRSFFLTLLPSCVVEKLGWKKKRVTCCSVQKYSLVRWGHFFHVEVIDPVGSYNNLIFHTIIYFGQECQHDIFGGHNWVTTRLLWKKVFPLPWEDISFLSFSGEMQRRKLEWVSQWRWWSDRDTPICSYCSTYCTVLYILGYVPWRWKVSIQVTGDITP